MQMRDQAVALARQGFKVFPLKPGAKAPPLVVGWPLAATTDETTIREWWAKWPDANIGIHCEGLLVLDVDVKKGGYESLAKLDLEVALPTTYEVATPSGGRHIYFRCDETVSNRVDACGAGLDIRAAGGYVVAPGSHTDSGEYRIHRSGDISDAPASLRGRLAGSAERAAGEGTGAVTDQDAAETRAAEFLAAHPVAIEGRGGDAHTYATVCRVRDFGVRRERVAELLADWNARCVPPWTVDDLAVKIRNAYEYAQDAPGKLTPEALGFEIVPDSGTQVPKTGTTDAQLQHPSEVNANEILGSDYLIKGVLERQSNAVLFGQWNVGKSFVVLDMAACVATGTPWFSKRVRAGAVLYLGYEGIRALRKRLVALRAKYPALTESTTQFAWAPLRHALTRPDGVAVLGGILSVFAARFGAAPDLVIIDPLANALGGDDSDAMLMGKLNECVATLIQKQRCTVLRVHHSGHGNQDRARGHSSLPAGIDTEIRVDADKIQLTKQRDDVRGAVSFRLKVVKLGEDSDGDPVTTCVVEHIPDNALDPSLTETQREFLDKAIAAVGEGGTFPKRGTGGKFSDIPAYKRRDIVKQLVGKRYLIEDGANYKVSERGPLAIFD